MYFVAISVESSSGMHPESPKAPPSKSGSDATFALQRLDSLQFPPINNSQQTRVQHQLQSADDGCGMPHVVRFISGNKWKETLTQKHEESNQFVKSKG